MGIHYVDFTPRLLEAESQFSTLSLSGDVPGPQYEDFDTVFKRSAEWLYRQKDIQPLHVEVLELTGVYQVESPLSEASALTRGASKNGIPSYLKVVRLWYRRLDSWQPLELSYDRSVLKYANIMPARLESTPRAFGPKFQTLSNAFEALSARLQEQPNLIKGNIVNIQTCVCRFSTKHCCIDPDRTFWLAANTDDMHVSYYFRIFYIRSKEPRSPYRVGFRDFAPQCDWKGKRRREQGEGFHTLVDAASDWLSQNPHLTMLNFDSVVHHAYYRCSRDTPGMEMRTLDNPHFRSTYWGLLDYVRILRVFYIQTTGTPPSHQPPESSSPILQSKVFHVHPAIPTESIRFAGITAQVPLNHDQLVHKINDWIKQNGVEICDVETVALQSNLTKVALSVDDTVQQAASKGPVFTIYGLRVYFMRPAEAVAGKSIDLAAVPRTVRLDEDSCVIL